MKNSGILRSAMWLTMGNLFLRLCSMVFQVYLSRALGPAGIGLLQLIFTVSTLAFVVGCAGVRTAAMYLSAEAFGKGSAGGVRQAIRLCLGYGLVTGSGVGAFLLVFAQPIAVHWLGDGSAALSLRLCGLGLPFSCLCAVMSGYFTACGKVRQYMVLEVAEKLVTMGATVLLLFRWSGADTGRVCAAIAGGGSLGTALELLLLLRLYWRDQRAVPSPGAKAMGRKLLRLCIPLALNDYLRWGLNTAEQFLIPLGLQRFGQSYDQAMGAYGTIHGMVFPALMFPAAILHSLADLLVPALSRAKAQGNRLRIRRLTERCLMGGFVYAALVGGFFLLCGQPLGLLLYQSERAGRQLRLYAAVVLILYTDAITDGILKGMGQQLHNVRYNTATGILDVLGLMLLLPRLGMTGFYLSFLLSHLLNLLLSLRRLLLVTGSRLRPMGMGRVLAVTGLGVVGVHFLIPAGLNPWAALVCRGGAYGLLIFLAFFSGKLPNSSCTPLTK